MFPQMLLTNVYNNSDLIKLTNIKIVIAPY